MEQNNFHVYIIYSKTADSFYRGYSQNVYNRLEVHNAGRSRYTSKVNDWELVFIQEMKSKSNAIKRERSIKKYSRKQIQELISSQINILN